MKQKTNVPTIAVVFSNNNNTLAKNQFAFQDEPNSRIRNTGDRLDKLTSKILRTIINFKRGVHPRLFCRRWFGLSVTNKNGKPRFTEEQILEMESEYGYREQCINLIARLLKIKPNTVQRWGKGVSFNKIPADKRLKYEIYLGYIDAIRVITASMTELDEAFLLRLLQQLETRE